MDHLVSLPRDSSVWVANHTEGKQLRKAKEDKRKKKQRKLQAWERREDTNSDIDVDGDDDEVVDDIKWDDLKNEDVLTGIGSSLQELGPFPLHGGEGMFGELAETGRTVGLPMSR